MIKNIAILGAGTMGSGLARLFAEQGCNVALYEPNEALLPAIQEKLRPLGIQAGSEILKAIADADLIVEAVPEDLCVKRDVYRQLAAGMRKDAIVASNTSTFALGTLADNQPFRDRMIIAHFFNPPQLIPLVEIVGLPSTPSTIIDRVTRLLRDCGRTPVVLGRDIPGFIANRLQAALMREACFLLDSGVADIHQIDAAVTEGLGMRWAFKGPFEIADLGGLDIWRKVTGHLFPTLDAASEAPESLVAKTESGQLGVKSGQGYYRYADPNGIVDEFQVQLEHLLKLKNEAGRRGEPE